MKIPHDIEGLFVLFSGGFLLFTSVLLASIIFKNAILRKLPILILMMSCWVITVMYWVWVIIELF